jgi:hypothetical protein
MEKAEKSIIGSFSDDTNTDSDTKVSDMAAKNTFDVLSEDGVNNEGMEIDMTLEEDQENEDKTDHDVETLDDDDLANSSFGKSIQKRVHMAKDVPEPTTTVRKTRDLQEFHRED